MGLVQLNYKNSNQRSNKYLDYCHVQHTWHSLYHTKQLSSPFNISQLPMNTDESSFEHFIEYLVGVRENSKF